MSLFVIKFLMKNKKTIEVKNLHNYVDKTKKIIDMLNTKSHEHKRNSETVKAMIGLGEHQEASKYINQIPNQEKNKECIHMLKILL
ncbi:hypothetical protein V2B37_13395 [Natranaerobius thermophilus JW/NM-WN-LF]